MSIPASPPAMSLRERALAAWEKAQAAQGRERAEKIGQARERLHGIIRNLVRTAFEICSYSVTLLGSDETFLFRFTECKADVVIDGEIFQVFNNDAQEGWGLYHCWSCPRCDGEPDVLTGANLITSLAGLGAWLEYAPTLHRCEAS